MADYKRFVSYMYEYDKGIKKKNVGYARVESRNGECRFTIRIQLNGLLEGIFPTYLIYRPKADMDLIYLGDSTVKNQVMDSRLSANELNIMDSGYRFSDMGGILLFLNSEVFYATEWDDKPVILEEVLQALKPKTKEELPADNEPTGKEEAAAVPAADVEKPISKTTSSDGEKTDIKPGSAYIIEDTGPRRHRYILPDEGTMNTGQLQYSPRKYTNPWELVNIYREAEGMRGYKDDKKASEDEFKVPEDEIKIPEDETKVSDDGLKISEDEEKISEDEIKLSEDEEKASEDGVRVPAEETKASEDKVKADRIFASFTRIYPFEDNEIKRCVKLEPKDIGSLPSDTWILSNNSFLLHGYYCYHHLIFAEMIDCYGCRYILGIPGIYHNRERFMARMFGFECFKSIRKRDLKQGDFGYWYTEVNF